MLDGCSWYRTRLPLERAQELELINFQEFDSNTDKIMELAKKADAYFLRFSFSRADAFIKEIKSLYPKKPIIFDIDDNYFIVNPLNDFYAEMGTKEVMADGKPLWIEGKDFDPYRNRKRVIDYEYCLAHATVVTVTTEKLAELVRPYNKNVVVIPNAIDFNRFPDVDVKHDDLRLLWSGGSSHFEDLTKVKADLERLMADYPTLNLYIYGQVFPSLFKNIDQKRLHTLGWINADGHGFRLATVGADVGFCPLVKNEFNSFKSSIKYYEMAALGIPVVCKNMLPYSEDITNGENGVLYTDDFYAQVKKLLDDKVLRSKIGQAGKEWVKKNRNIRDTGKVFGQMLTDLVQASVGFDIKQKEPIKKFSIVIPCHNRLKLAKQTLQSLRQSTPRDLYELIVVDDDSSDGTREWLETQDIDKLVKVSHHSCGASKNEGMKYATCDYIYISDADMYFGKDWYKDLINIYPKLSPTILGAVGHPYWKELRSFKVDGKDIHMVEQQPGNSWMITKDIWYKCGPLLEGVGAGVDDTEFCDRAKKKGIFVAYLDTKVLHCGLKRADGTDTYGSEQFKDYPKGVIVE